MKSKVQEVLKFMRSKSADMLILAILSVFSILEVLQGELSGVENEKAIIILFICVVGHMILKRLDDKDA